MNLHFGICWIEDQASGAEVEAVEQAVRNNGFEPKIDRIESEQDIQAFSTRQQHFQDYDLILLDLRLGRGLRGDDIAPNVRNAFRSTPILFYSAEDEVGLRRKMAEKLVDGVYCVHRDRMSVRVGELVGHLAPALNRLSSMRGLAARVVAECDQDFRAILTHLAAMGSEAEIVQSLKEKVREGAGRQVAEIEPIATLEGLLSSHYVHSGALYLETREQSAAAGGDEAMDILRSLRKGYQSQVLARRNTLAHALETRTERGWEITRVGAAPLTVEKFQTYRRDFLNQLDHVRRLRVLLVGE